MADLNKQELRRLARCASTGPWKAEMEGGRMNVASEDWYLLEMHHDQPLFMTDAAYIAAASPTTILTLLDELERLESFKTAYMEWQDKTEWVQKTAQPKELGKHRADILAERLKSLDAQCAALASYVEDLAKGCGARGSAVLGSGIGALLEPAKDDGEGSVNG